MRAIHRQRIKLRSYETDPLGRLQVPILCKLLQEVAVAHASILGVAVEKMAERGTAWVLSRQHLALNRWPRGDEEIIIRRVWGLHAGNELYKPVRKGRA